MINKAKSGFTIVDLLVAISIFVILTSLTIANFVTGKRRDALRQSGIVLVSLLQEAQTAALSGMTINGLTPTGGYGLHFDSAIPNQVIYFADTNGNEMYDQDTDLIVNGQSDKLADDVVINSLMVGEDTLLMADFVFKAPEGNRYLNGLLNGGRLEINILHQKTNQTIKVSASTSSGQITTN